LTTGAHVCEHGFNAVFVDQAQCSAGHAQAHPTVFALNPEPAVLQVGHEAALGFVVGVGNIVPAHRAFARYVAHFCHASSFKYQQLAASEVQTTPVQQTKPRLVRWR
jgi:hypothetical protein